MLACLLVLDFFRSCLGGHVVSVMDEASLSLLGNSLTADVLGPWLLRSFPTLSMVLPEPLVQEL